MQHLLRRRGVVRTRIDQFLVAIGVLGIVLAVSLAAWSKM